jgi:hypothetical protein
MPTKYQRQNNLKKYFMVSGLLVLVAITMYFANYLIQRAAQYRAGAAAGNAQLYFEPTSATLPPNALVNVWVTTDKPMAFARVEFTFDPTRLMLTQEITLANPDLKRIKTLSTMAEANASGKVVIVVGLDPTTFNTATTTGNFKLATLSLSPKVTTSNLQTTLAMIAANLQLVDTTATPFTLTTTPATLTLNPLASPSPTPLASTSTPTPTPTPDPNADLTAPSVSITSPSNGASLKAKSSVTLSATASDNLGVTQVQFLVNNIVQCTLTAAPYSCSWTVPAGRKSPQIKAVAKDDAGNSSVSTITVKNQVN